MDCGSGCTVSQEYSSGSARDRSDRGDVGDAGSGGAIAAEQRGALQGGVSEGGLAVLE